MVNGNNGLVPCHTSCIYTLHAHSFESVKTRGLNIWARQTKSIIYTMYIIHINARIPYAMINILTIRSQFFFVFLLKIGNPLRFVYHWATKWAYCSWKAIQLAISYAAHTNSNKHASLSSYVVQCCVYARVCFFHSHSGCRTQSLDTCALL